MTKPLLYCPWTGASLDPIPMVQHEIGLLIISEAFSAGGPSHETTFAAGVKNLHHVEDEIVLQISMVLQLSTQSGPSSVCLLRCATDQSQSHLYNTHHHQQRTFTNNRWCEPTYDISNSATLSTCASLRANGLEIGHVGWASRCYSQCQSSARSPRTTSLSSLQRWRSVRTYDQHK